MEQLAGGGDSIAAQDGAGTVHGQIAEVFDELGFGEHGIARSSAEAGFVNQSAQVILVRQTQRRVMLVEPGHGQLESAAGVEAGGACIGVRHSFGLAGCAVQGRPFGLEEGEVAHY